MNNQPFSSDFALNALVAPPGEVAESVYQGEGYDERKMLAQYASDFTSNGCYCRRLMREYPRVMY